MLGYHRGHYCLVEGEKPCECGGADSEGDGVRGSSGVGDWDVEEEKREEDNKVF